MKVLIIVGIAVATIAILLYGVWKLFTAFEVPGDWWEDEQLGTRL